MSVDPFTIDESTPVRVRFSRFVSEPVTAEHENRLREHVTSELSVVFDLTETMTLSTDWWRLLGRMGALARRTGAEVQVVGANSVGLRTADRVGATDLLKFEAAEAGETQ